MIIEYGNHYLVGEGKTERMADAKRRLAAILSADVAGYSRLMGDDSRATMDTLNVYRDVFRRHISDRDGRVVDTAGDSVLALFDSIVEAVQCAVDVQGELEGCNAGLPEDRRMHFRVGVNLGDIYEQDDGAIYGNGVNVAARLERLAEPGGICLSGSAHEQVEDKINRSFEDIGAHAVKNITRPVRVFRVMGWGASAVTAPEKPITSPGIMKGQQVGHYQIIEKIGEGGMGVVYRAEDTRLKRAVALKFLPPESTRSAEARERFIHEAQAASALDHPNICTIHEIDETVEGQVYITMGLYEGQTLRERIAERPLKLEDAIDITSQIAKGLAKAHEQKIIHRDIKPANIFITNEGQVKILDFGLAKLHGQTKLTMTGTTLGTVSYMAPEQARGDEVDHRADIWSLGVLMYEMLTGQQPFKGEHEQAVIYSILNEEPESITALRTGIPIDLEWIVQKALKKNPKQRYQHSDEIPVDLMSVEDRRISSTKISMATISASGTASRLITSQPVRKVAIALSLALALVAGIIIKGILTPTSRVSRGPLQRFPVALTEVLSEKPGTQLALSPDGQLLLFGAIRYTPDGSRTSQVFARPIDELESRSLEGMQDPSWLTFSPSGEWFAFNGGFNTLTRHSLVSNQSIEIAPIGPISGMDWGSDDTIVYSRRDVGRLMRVAATGGVPTAITLEDSLDDAIHLYWPHFLPGCNEIIVTLWDTDSNTIDNAQVAVLSLETGELKTVTPEGRGFAEYIPSIQHLVYVRDNTLVTLPFDIKSLEPMGEEIVTSIEVHCSLNIWPQFTISETGTLIYQPPGQVQPPQENLIWVDLSGNVSRLDIEPRSFGLPSLSHDGTKVAVAVEDENEDGVYDLWIFETDGSNSFKLTSNVHSAYAVWHPDGGMVAFASNRNGDFDVYLTTSDAPGGDSLLIGSEYNEFPSSWAPDGSILVYSVTLGGQHRDIYFIDEHGESVAAITEPGFKASAVMSPDGRYIAYVSSESQSGPTIGVYVQQLSESGSSTFWTIDEGVYPSGNPCWEPRWAPDGSALYYKSGGRLMRVEVELEPIFRKAKDPEVLFDLPQYVPNSAWFIRYDIHPEGDRFLMEQDQHIPAASTIHIINNWFEEIRRLQPDG